MKVNICQAHPRKTKPMQEDVAPPASRLAKRSSDVVVVRQNDLKDLEAATGNDFVEEVVQIGFPGCRLIQHPLLDGPVQILVERRPHSIENIDAQL